MRIEFKELKKALDYIDKHSDKGKVTVIVVGQGTVKDHVQLVFNTLSNDTIAITLPADERSFSCITKTERF